MAEAPHGTAPSPEARNVANPMAMILAVAAVLHHVAESGGPEAARPASRWVRESVLDAVRAGVRTPDLGGEATTTGFTDEVIARIRRRSEGRAAA